MSAAGMYGPLRDGIDERGHIEQIHQTVTVDVAENKIRLKVTQHDLIGIGTRNTVTNQERSFAIDGINPLPVTCVIKKTKNGSGTGVQENERIFRFRREVID